MSSAASAAQSIIPLIYPYVKLHREMHFLADAHMRLWIVLSLLCVICAPAFAQQDKKTDDLKPADPDFGESTLEERTLGLLPNPFEKQGIKFAITYIARFSVIPWAALSGARFTKIVLIFAVDTDLEKLVNLK
jgi:porin